jgi:hypothetical protein
MPVRDNVSAAVSTAVFREAKEPSMRVHNDAALKLRLSVCFTRGKLDRLIAEGHPCAETAALNLRARQLVDLDTRRQAAASLRSIVGYADRAGSGWLVSAVVIERAAVRSGREAILGLAERLEGPAPVSPRGVAQVQTLLTDGLRSPLFNRHCRRTIVEAVWEAADLLDLDTPSIGFDALAF